MEGGGNAGGKEEVWALCLALGFSLFKYVGTRRQLELKFFVWTGRPCPSLMTLMPGVGRGMSGIGDMGAECGPVGLGRLLEGWQYCSAKRPEQDMDQQPSGR